MQTASINRAIAEIAAANHGIVSVRAAEERGIHRQSLHARTRNGHLERVATGVYRVAGSPATWDQRALTAVAAAGPEALLSHRAAARLWALDGVRWAKLEVLLPRGRRHARAAGAVATVHEARDVVGEDLAERSGIPCTSAVRTVLDLPGVLHPFRAEQALEDALRKRLCTVDQLVDRFVRVARRGRPGTRVMRELLRARSAAYVPTMSELERRTAEVLDRWGVPAAVHQHPVDLGGRVVYVDFAWPELRIAVECDGLFHHGHNQRLPWDERRQNELVLRGWLVLRFTWRQLVDEPETVARHVLAAHRSRTGVA